MCVGVDGASEVYVCLLVVKSSIHVVVIVLLGNIVTPQVGNFCDILQLLIFILIYFCSYFFIAF